MSTAALQYAAALQETGCTLASWKLQRRISLAAPPFGRRCVVLR